MNSLQVMVVAAALLGTQLAVPNEASAQSSWPKVAYQATFEHYLPSGNFTSTQYSDGKGHIRSETKMQGTQSSSILDFPNKVTYALIHATKQATRMPLDSKAWQTDPDELKKLKAQPLPPKVIDGHPCTGWRYTTDGHVTEVWAGKDTDCAVLTTMDGKPSMRLTSFSRANPPANLFSVPAGYKVVELPDFAKLYGQGQGAVPDLSKYSAGGR